MNYFEKMKIKRECKKTGRMEEFKWFIANMETLERDIIMYTTTLESSRKKFEEIKRNFPQDSKEYIEARDEVYRWSVELDGCYGKLKYIRPNQKSDIEYRDYQINNYKGKLQEILSPNLDLRFHGTPIYSAEQIIKDGGIFSLADRYDSYRRSTDFKGQISASTGKTIGRTLDIFSDIIAYRRCLPCGCIFAVLPKNKEDANLRFRYII